MMRSLYSGVSGLRNHQTRMDVIGNNIANVNTVGFKASRTIFQDMYSQNMRAAGAPGETTGGTNPQQIGLGVTLSTIDTLFTRSAAQVTGNTYDLMIENDGFFVVRNGYGDVFEEFYSRAGNFYEDKSHYLVTANGFYLQGYKATLTEGTEPIEAQNADLADLDPASITDTEHPAYGIEEVPDDVDPVLMDGLGAASNNIMYIVTYHADENTISVAQYDISDPARPIAIKVDQANKEYPTGDPGTTVTTDSGLILTVPPNGWGTGGAGLADGESFAFTTGNQGRDKAGRGDPVAVITADMDRIYIDENLYNVSIDKNGLITALVKETGFIRDPFDPTKRIAVESDNRVTIGMVAVATFDNQQGLEKVGSNLYRTTPNTGDAQYKHPGTDGAGAINPGALEMSNVDLAQEFTDMIVTQRGFQANSRIITVSDTLLEELVNLKR